MCQLCDEANLYMAQLEAAERKATEAKARSDDGKPEKAADKQDGAAVASGAK